MDPAALIAILTTAIAALFAWGRQSEAKRAADAWRLYEAEREERKETQTGAAADIRDLTAAVREMAGILQALPKRREDWTDPEPAPARRRQT